MLMFSLACILITFIGYLLPIICIICTFFSNDSILQHLQAALGPVALVFAKENHREDVEQWAKNILTIAVLSILVTAPIGAIGISLGGPRLLSKEEPVKKNKKDKRVDVALVEDQM